jgi:O-antigen/teichoic acid export membrane protein
VLARLLIPRAFGLVAMLNVFTGFAVVFIDLGISMAIVQRQRVEERHLNTQFWLNLSMGGILTLATIALAPAIALFYDEPRLVALTIAIAPAFLLSGLAATQTAILDRRMDFRTLSIVENVALVIANVVAIAMALDGFGVWSLVGLALAQPGVRALLLWFVSSWRPTGGPDRVSFGELWGFGSGVTGYSILNYWAKNADNLLIGRFIGPTPLAYYNRAYNLMLMPSDAVVGVTTRVMIPALSRLQDDRERVRRIYLNAIGLIALLMFPLILGLLVVSRSFILSIYGPKWAPVIPLLQILCIVSLIQVITRTAAWIFTTQGRTDMLFRWGVFGSITAIISFFIGLPWGTHGVATAYLIWNILTAIPLFAYAGKLIDLTVTEVLGTLAGVTGASIAMGAVVWIVERELPGHWGSPAHLLVGILVGTLTYSLFIYATSPRPFQEFKRLLRHYRERRASPLPETGG